MLRDSCYIWFVYNNINNWLIACTMQRNIVSSYYCRSFCPNSDFYIFFHYTCIWFRELIWNLYCSLIIKKNYQIWVLITMYKQKQKLILNDSCFFLYRVLPFENSLAKFYWSYLAFEIGGVGKGACTAYAIFSEYLLLEHTVKHRSMSSWRCQY